MLRYQTHILKGTRMITIQNGHDDRDITIVARSVIDGRDGEPTTVGPGRGADIVFDGNHQIVISAGPLQVGEIPATTPPVATLHDSPAGAGRTLTAATDDDIKAAIAKAVEDGHVSAKKVPHMDAINANLAEGGFEPIKATKRDELLQAA